VRSGTTGARRSYRFFKVIGYRTRLTSARNALNYAAFRSEGAKQGALIFDDRTDSADVKSFLGRLDDPVSRHPRAAKAFHALFSLPTDAHARAGIHWPDVVREVMRHYEIQTGKRLDWIAVEHPDPRHRHVHLVLKGVFTDRAGRSKRLFLGRAEIERIKELVGRALEARGLMPEHMRTGREEARPTRPARDRSERIAMAGAVLDWLTQSIKAHQRRRQQDLDKARQEAERQHGGRGR